MIANEHNLPSSFLKSTSYMMELPAIRRPSAARHCPAENLTPTPYFSSRTYYPIREFPVCNTLPASSSSFSFGRSSIKETSIAPISNYSYDLNDDSYNSRASWNHINRGHFQTWCYPNRSSERQKLYCDPHGSYNKPVAVNDRDEVLFAFQNRDHRGSSLAQANYDNYYNCSLPRRVSYSGTLPSYLRVAERNPKELPKVLNQQPEHLCLSSLSISLRRDARKTYMPDDLFDDDDVDDQRNSERNVDVVNMDNGRSSPSFVAFSGADYSPLLTHNNDIGALGRINRSLSCQHRLGPWDNWKRTNSSVSDVCYTHTPKTLYGYKSLTTAGDSMDSSSGRFADKSKRVVSETYVQTGSDKSGGENVPATRLNSTRVKPPLPPNPPSRSRILRYSHSVSGFRKQKPSAPLPHISTDTIIDAFQETEQKRNEPRMRARASGSGGYGPPGRTGITAAGTGPSISSQMAMAPSSKKKKSKKEKKSKLRKADISNPTNFTHKAHIGWDASGGFSQETYDNELMDNSVRDLLRAAGENPDRMTKDEIDFTYRFLHQYQKGGVAPAAPARKAQKPAAAKQRPPPPQQQQQQQAAGVRPPEGPPAPPSEPSSNLPPVCTNAPPPPPPPPVVARPPPAATSEDSSEGGSDLLSQIRSGTSLKSASESAPTPPKPASRDDVLAQIRQGKVLKTVDKAALEQKKEANLEDIGGIAGALAKALKDIREKVHDSEESSEEDDENNDDEWASD